MKGIRRLFWPLLLTVSLGLTVFNFIACTKEKTGKECSSCDSDVDCNAGMTCEVFFGSGGSAVAFSACATSSTKTCPEP
ncbi:MAG: hypothetical protein ACOYNC_14955 [Bacteroidales bacterium]